MMHNRRWGKRLTGPRTITVPVELRKMGATIGLRGCAEFLKGVSVELQLETCYSSKWDVLQMAEAMMSVDGGGPPGLVLGGSTNFLDRHEHLGSEWGPIEA